MNKALAGSKQGTWKSRAMLGTGTLLIAAQLSHAASAPGPVEIDTMREQLEQQSRKLTQQQQLLEAELKKLEQHRRELQETRRAIEAMRAQLGMPVDIQPTQIAQADDSMYRGRGPDTSRVDTTLDVATVFNQPSIMTPKGTFILDPSLQYSFSSSDRVSIIGFSVLNAVLIGQIDVRSVNRSSWIASLGGRYGLTNRLEIETRVPYVYRTDDTVTRPIGGVASDQLFSSDGNGLGDIELAARYQFNAPRDDGAFYVAGLRFKTRTGKDPYEVEYDTNFNLPKELATGSGFYSLQPSLSAVLPADPVVFFGGINYVWNIKRDVNAVRYTNGSVISFQNIGEVDPGDSVGLNFGMGLALNERSSFSLSYEHTWIDKTTFDGQVANDALAVQLATLQAGFSYRLNKRTNLNLSVGAGLTDDTPDTTLTLRVPIRF
ncbi:MAG TPA: hypothetical protein PLE48_00340 [Thiobacillus sp.]|nr:hypothetical protein [Thiobacillus sp.]